VQFGVGAAHDDALESRVVAAQPPLIVPRDVAFGTPHPNPKALRLRARRSFSGVSLQHAAKIALADRVGERLKAQIGIQPAVEILEAGELAPSDAAEGRVKTRRVIEKNS